jgi:hypothetical protein
MFSEQQQQQQRDSAPVHSTHDVHAHAIRSQSYQQPAGWAQSISTAQSDTSVEPAPLLRQQLQQQQPAMSAVYHTNGALQPSARALQQQQQPQQQCAACDTASQPSTLATDATVTASTASDIAATSATSPLQQRPRTPPIAPIVLPPAAAAAAAALQVPESETLVQVAVRVDSVCAPSVAGMNSTTAAEPEAVAAVPRPQQQLTRQQLESKLARMEVCCAEWQARKAQQASDRAALQALHTALAAAEAAAAVTDTVSDTAVGANTTASSIEQQRQQQQQQMLAEVVRLKAQLRSFSEWRATAAPELAQLKADVMALA